MTAYHPPSPKDSPSSAPVFPGFPETDTLKKKPSHAATNVWGPYVALARWHRPIGVFLLLLPCWWGLVLGSSDFPELWLLGVYAMGAILMRGAGCTYNDLVDAPLDKKVARTSGRPLPSGRLPPWKAWVFLCIQGLLGFFLLWMLPPVTIILGGASLGLVALYPWMKRWTYWPQLFLGLTFNWGILMGWSSVNPCFEEWTLKSILPPLLLYGAGIFWTLIYDTLYAHQDRQDDARVGIKSTALKFGEKTPLYLLGFGGGFLGLLGFVGILSALHPFYYWGLGGVAIQLGIQVYGMDIHNPSLCGRQFKAHGRIGITVLLALLGGRFL